jgi:hypothetical protein
MKLKSIHIILIVILVVAIFAITSSDTVVPYSRDTLFSHMYKYEGMDNQDSSNTDAAKSFQDYVNQNVKLPNPLSPSEFNNAISSMGKKSENDTTKKTASGDSEEPKKVEGFSLQPAPFGDSQVLDRYGSTPSGPQCFGQGSGYSKSLGPLCLSKEDARLLSTRGGNISGTDSTIGY